MGIPGLSSYISKRSKIFLKDFELHDTYLVIDGNCILVQLYASNRCNFCYGGDYGEYACYVNEFFDNLLKCKVTPLIIFDGGLEDKKMNTICNRSKQRILAASISTPSSHQIIPPPLVREVFRYIVREKNIKCVQSTFEADDHIASIARILNCPVLSYDSDFFIYDVMYIPYNTLKQGISMNVNGLGCVKHCKIFTHEYFLENFPGMDKSVLPLVAVLLGNDYLSTNLFNNFFSTLKISKKFKQMNRSKLHMKIEAVFRWIQHHRLDNAVTVIIRKLDPDKRQSIIEVIEVIINGYLSLSSAMLGPLGYSQEEISALMQGIPCESYKFKDLDNLNISDDRVADDETDLSCDENAENLFSSEECMTVKPRSENNVEKIIPSWFLEKYNAAKFPAFFMNIINRQLIVVSDQMEDYSQPACVNISLKIISVTFRLLSNGTTNSNILKYIARGKGANIVTYELDCKTYKLNFEVPTLQKLVELPKFKRNQIFVSSLGVSDKFMEEFPLTLKLYIAVIKYWLEDAESIFRTKYHLYALVFSMINHVIRNETRHQLCFKNINLKKTKNEDCNNKDVQCFPSVEMPIKTALENVTQDDCEVAKEYFHFQTHINNKEFDIAVVHSFSLFQSCLRSSMHLNALLGFPCRDINVAEFFSGTLVYNLYNDLKNYKNLNQHVASIFKDSPSILQLFVSVSVKIQGMVKQQQKTD